MSTHVLVLTVEIHLKGCHSLKDKRSVTTPILEGARNRFRVASAETDFLDRHNHAELGFSCVSSSVGHATGIIDNLERFVWSFPEVEVVSSERVWADLS